MMEVVVTAALLALAMLPTLSLLSTGTRSADRTGRKLLLGQLARVVIEDLKGRGYDAVASRPWADVLADPDPRSPLRSMVNHGATSSDALPLGDVLFRSVHERLRSVRYRVDVADGAPAPGLKRVTVTFEAAVGTATSTWSFATVVAGQPL